MSHVVVIASCTKRKRRAPDPSLYMRSVPHGSVADRFDVWRDRIRSATEHHRAADLYGGDHWASVLKLQALAGTELSLWVCSAGLGLVRASARVPAYSATFSRGHADAVALGATAEQFRNDQDQWWDELRAWAGPEDGVDRTVEGIVRHNPNANFVVIAAGEYLRVMAPDLLRAVGCLASPEQMTLFSADAREDARFRDFTAPVSADIAASLGGSMHSLNARAAKYAFGRLEGRTASRTTFVDILQELMESSAPRPKHDRVAVSDEQVLDFLRQRLQQDPKGKKTKLLTEFRANGNACEQSRFGKLFEQVRSSLPK